MKYLGPTDYRDYIVTHYRVEETQEFVMRWTQKLGPIQLENDEGEDIVFTLEDIDGIFVASKKDTMIIDIHD
jgi:hypothetical protein